MTTMNDRMARVFTVLCVGFGGIVVLLTWWQVVVAGELRQKDENNQTAYYEQRVQRGFISTRDGVRVAGRMARVGANGDTIYTRRYPQGTLAAHVLGYDTRGHSRAGVERALNDVLTGSTRDLGAVVGLLDGDEAAIGDDVQLTIDAQAQRVAEQALAQTGAPGGAVVAVEPETGRVLVMASWPTFAPGDVLRDFGGVERGGGSLFNRATQGQYPPGSTFKVITAAAALEAGVSPGDTFKGGCTFATPGPDIENFGGACVPRHDFTEALTNSYNVTFAELGARLGDEKLRRQMQEFGFFETPPIDGIPGNEIRESGLTEGGKRLEPDADFDETRVAIGQDKLAVTPLQMALVAAAIGAEGRVPEPRIVERITRGGSDRVIDRIEPRTWRQAISPGVADQLTKMMTNVVEAGSGAQARIEGVEVAGKTGTADAPGGNITWFIAFAPADAPKVAIAVAIEGQSEGQTGGAVAAPIARAVMESLP